MRQGPLLSVAVIFSVLVVMAPWLCNPCRAQEWFGQAIIVNGSLFHLETPPDVLARDQNFQSFVALARHLPRSNSFQIISWTTGNSFVKDEAQAPEQFVADTMQRMRALEARISLHDRRTELELLYAIALAIEHHHSYFDQIKTTLTPMALEQAKTIKIYIVTDSMSNDVKSGDQYYATAPCFSGPEVRYPRLKEIVDSPFRLDITVLVPGQGRVIPPETLRFLDVLADLRRRQNNQPEVIFRGQGLLDCPDAAQPVRFDPPDFSGSCTTRAVSASPTQLPACSTQSAGAVAPMVPVDPGGSGGGANGTSGQHAAAPQTPVPAPPNGGGGGPPKPEPPPPPAARPSSVALQLQDIQVMPGHCADQPDIRHLAAAPGGGDPGTKATPGMMAGLGERTAQICQGGP